MPLSRFDLKAFFLSENILWFEKGLDFGHSLKKKRTEKR